MPLNTSLPIRNAPVWIRNSLQKFRSGKAATTLRLGVLAKQSLRATDFLSKKQLRDHIAAYIKHWNAEPTPSIWTKPAAAIIRSHQRMLARIS